MDIKFAPEIEAVINALLAVNNGALPSPLHARCCHGYHVIISVSSSIVPTPPGRAMNPSTCG